eukprot:COSAG04_NODE_25_length_37336_cov_18.966941_15_plen_207_part_00
MSDSAVTMSSSQTTAPFIATSEVHERPAATGASLYAFCTMSCSPLTFSSKGAATSTPGQRSVYAQRFQRPSGLSQQFSMVWRQLSVPGPHWGLLLQSQETYPSFRTAAIRVKCPCRSKTRGPESLVPASAGTVVSERKHRSQPDTKTHHSQPTSLISFCQPPKQSASPIAYSTEVAMLVWLVALQPPRVSKHCHLLSLTLCAWHVS